MEAEFVEVTNGFRCHCSVQEFDFGSKEEKLTLLSSPFKGDANRYDTSPTGT